MPEGAKPAKKVAAKHKRAKPKAKEDAEPVRRTVELRPEDLGGNEYAGEVRLTNLEVPTFEGVAKYTWHRVPGTTYEGYFDSSSITGNGRLTWPDGSHYEGGFLKGMRHGHGTFVWKDGKTQYSGQWENGQRHGWGRLDYAEGGQYFEGEWVCGMKHGKGKQVWAQGTSFEGIWQDGIIHGDGTMTWTPDKELGKDAVPETYSGDWWDGRPHGKGTHTWTAKPTKLELIKHHAGQQRNNGYSGEWKEGERSGTGIFYYANGSTFEGTWSRNQKHGAGVFTYEDGAVFKGMFNMDVLTEPANVMRPSTGKAVLNIGGEDNPVRKCVTIRDLDPGQKTSTGGGGEAAFRETFNMLLRYFGELKHLYFRYRAVEAAPEQDPFTMTTLQLWILARDLDCITATLPLAAINRAIATGERFLGEAVPDGFGSRSALKQTPVPTTAGTSEDQVGRRKLSGDGTPSRPTRPHAESKDTSSAGVEAPGKKRRSESGDNKSTRSLPSSPARKNSPQRKHSHDSDEKTLSRDSKGGDEDRPDPATDEYLRRGVDIHNYDRVLLMRHFLELVVRLAVARYPDTPTLDAQLNELIQTQVLRLERSISLETFHFWVNREIRSVLELHLDALYVIFEQRSLGVQFPGKHVAEHGRQAGINGRRDVTIRVRDVLQILEERGLLTDEPWVQPPATVPLLGLRETADSEDMPSEVGKMVEDLAEGVASGLALGTEEGTDSFLAELGLGSEFSSLDLGNALGGVFGGGDSGPSALDNLRLGPTTAMVPIPSKDAPSEHARGVGGPEMSEEHSGDVDKITGEKEIEVVLPAKTAPEPSWVMRNDLRVNKQEVLEIVTEVLSPHQRGNIRATVPRGELSSPAHVTLLEYMETEMIFFEFLRLLWRISEERVRSDMRPAETGQANAKLSPAQKLQGYLEHAFMPGTYAPPSKPSPPGTPVAPVEDSKEGLPISPAPGEEAAEDEAAPPEEKTSRQATPAAPEKPATPVKVVIPRWERRLDPAEVYADAAVDVPDREAWSGFASGLPAAPRAFPRSRLQADKFGARSGNQGRTSPSLKVSKETGGRATPL